MKKRRLPIYFKVLLAILVILVIVVLSILLTKINALDPRSQEVQELYAYLGDGYLDYCGGMPLYNGNSVTSEKLDIDTKMCMAYKQITKEKVGETTLSNTKKKDICEFSSDKLFRLDDESDVCTVNTLKQTLLEAAYYKLFGEKLKNNKDFNLSGSVVCYYSEEEGSYTCGNAQAQTIELGWAPTMYRMITKAKKKGKDIIIYDYYLAINNDTCYLSNNGNKENKECSEKINSKTEYTSRFVAKNGQMYMHTFSPDKDGIYHWKSTTPID